MITIDQVSVSYGKKQILTRISSQAPAGQVTAIIGPNGSGKSTLVKALSGDISYEGQIRLDGRDIRKIPAWQMALRRAVLPQFCQVAFPFTVAEIVRMGLTASREGVSDETASDKILSALEKVDLADFANRHYQDLSGGEQQRVQMARILTQIPEPVKEGQANYLFLDEPIASLDIQHQLSLLQLAKEFSQQGGGVILVLHDLNLTALFADYVLLMSGGQVVTEGRPSDVIRDDILSHVYHCPLKVGRLPDPGSLFVLPQSALMSRI